LEWCAKTHLHKCSGSGDAAAFILQRSVHCRANTLSRHKYLAGEQGGRWTRGGEEEEEEGWREGEGERRSAGHRGYVCTHREDRWFSTTQFPDCHAGERDERGREEGRKGWTYLSHFQITHSRYSHLHGRRLANLLYTSPCIARFVTSTSMPITLSDILYLYSRRSRYGVKWYKNTSDLYFVKKLQFDNKIINTVDVSNFEWKLCLCIFITFTLLHAILHRLRTDDYIIVLSMLISNNCHQKLFEKYTACIRKWNKFN